MSLLDNTCLRPNEEKNLYKDLYKNLCLCWLRCKHLKEQPEKVRSRESQRDVVYLDWPIALSYTYEPKCVEGRGVAGSQPMSTVQLNTWSPNILLRSNSIFNLWFGGRRTHCFIKQRTLCIWFKIFEEKSREVVSPGFAYRLVIVYFADLRYGELEVDRQRSAWHTTLY